MSGMNTSGLSPIEYNVVVLPEEIENKTKGGLILADETVEKKAFGRMEGTLVAMSPMAFSFEDWPEGAEDQKPKVGDRVMFSRHSGTEVTGRDGRDYWILKDKSIVAVMKDD